MNLERAILHIERAMDASRFTDSEFSLVDVESLEIVLQELKKRNKEVKKEERTCYNCKHGAYGFDGDLGCNIWHRGIANPMTCGSWEGTERKEE